MWSNMKYSLSYLFLNSVPLEGTTPTAWSASKGLFESLYIDALVISITKLKRVFFWRFLRILLEVHYIHILDRLEKKFDDVTCNRNVHVYTSASCLFSCWNPYRLCTFITLCVSLCMYVYLYVYLYKISYPTHSCITLWPAPSDSYPS